MNCRIFFRVLLVLLIVGRVDNQDDSRVFYNREKDVREFNLPFQHEVIQFTAAFTINTAKELMTLIYSELKGLSLATLLTAIPFGYLLLSVADDNGTFCGVEITKLNGELLRSNTKLENALKELALVERKINIMDEEGLHFKKELARSEGEVKKRDMKLETVMNEMASLNNTIISKDEELRKTKNEIASLNNEISIRKKEVDNALIEVLETKRKDCKNCRILRYTLTPSVMSKSGGVALTTALFTLALIDIIGNSLVCTIIKRNRDMRVPINYLIVNLAVADILYATFIAPEVIVSVFPAHPDGLTGTIVCKLLTGGNLAWVGAASSAITFSAIAIERYYAVMYPLGNKGKLTKRKIKVIIAGSWIFSLLLNIPLFLVRNLEKRSNRCVDVWPESWMGKAYSLIWLSFTLLTLALMAGLYSRVVYALWFKGDDDNQLTHQQRGVTKVRKRVTLMVLTVSAMFGICWGTDLVLYVLWNYSFSNMRPMPIAIANTMVLFNSAVNPFVYALLNKQFREKLKGVIHCTGSSALRFRSPPGKYREWSLPTMPVVHNNAAPRSDH
ncbi:hypothetical protein ACROYT_G015713 [Oculina patagonica]